MKNNLLAILKDMGLSDLEASVYLASLSLGPASVSKISRNSDVKRTSVYPIINSLKQKGLMNIELRGWKKLYTAESPEKLKFIIDDKLNKLKNGLPDFMAMYNLRGGESFIKYYEGIAGIKSVYESFLRDIQPHDDYLVISDTEEWFNLDPEYFSSFLERRAKFNINVRMLLQDKEKARELKKKEQGLNFKIKLLPPETKLTTNMVVIPQRILIQQLTPPIIGIVIENKSIIQMNQQLFEIMWKSIKEENNIE
ncbi:MAG TPA: helix-turn-helix domain-containing protein [Candidatus Moranbacteria bacterium]|nr:helix-turn-helix domain-containing protein [Candidatus Moranbacteria bacterium]